MEPNSECRLGSPDQLITENNHVESGLDTHLKWRMSLQGGLMYMFHTKFSGQDLGGVGFRLRVGVNW